MVQNNETFCLYHFISQEPEIIVILLPRASFFYFFKILIFCVFRNLSHLNLPVSGCFAFVPGTVDHIIQNFDNICRYFTLKKKGTLSILKLFCFLLAHFNRFFNKCLFFKFINKFQNEILRCAPSSSHVCDFLLLAKCFITVCFSFS